MATDLERAMLPPPSQAENSKSSEGQAKRSVKWWLIAINFACLATGTIGGPLVVRLYFLHGGSRTWLSSWLQTAGFPILLGPLAFLYARHRARGLPFFAEPKLLAASAVIGLLLGLDSFMYSQGLSYLPVSTSSLLFSTQLAFTAFFALIIVKQRFSPYSINAVVLMTLGAVLLGMRKSGDRPAGVTNSEYLLGFIITLGTAALLGFLLPCIELAYAKASRTINYAVVMQFQLGVTFFATLFCTFGMIANKDFQAIGTEARAYNIGQYLADVTPIQLLEWAISGEARSFDIGQAKYYLVLAGCAVMFQLVYIGSLGLVFCTSSLFAGVATATMLPLTEIAAVIFFKETFTGEKGMALAMCLWGFTSYFYGAYRIEKKQKENQKQTPEEEEEQQQNK